jgi:hypothetical protein
MKISPISTSEDENISNLDFRRVKYLKSLLQKRKISPISTSEDENIWNHDLRR